MSNTFNPADCHVALLSGGTSGEREISLKSGDGAFGALTEAGFKITRLDPAEKGDLKRLIDEDFDVAFLTTHGKNGEDGKLQGFLELIGLPYTGSGVWASATAMDKSKAKVFYRLAGIPTAESITIGCKEEITTAEIVEKLGAHVVLKPVLEGSSLGVVIVDNEEDMEREIQEARKFGMDILIEQYISGTELTVAVLGNDDPHAYPIIEIVPKAESYDFESKYAPGGSEHICPARLSEEVTAVIKDYAEKAHKALNCAGVSRTDFIVTDEGKPYVLETNTLPGMTATSLLPDAARAEGLSFPDLCINLVKYALE